MLNGIRSSGSSSTFSYSRSSGTDRLTSNLPSPISMTRAWEAPWLESMAETITFVSIAILGTPTVVL